MFSLAIQQFQNAGGLIGLVFAIEGFAKLHVHLERFERAAQLIAWADAVREKMGDQRPPVEQNSVERDLAAIHSKLNEEEYSKFYSEGSTMTTEQAIALALEEV